MTIAASAHSAAAAASPDLVVFPILAPFAIIMIIPMEQASRIFARSKGLSKVIDHEQVACGAWAGLVGKRLARYSRAAKLVRDRLVVEVDDEIWRQSLYGLRFQLLRKLEAALGEGVVRDLEFKVMPVRFSPRKQAGANLFDPPVADDAESIEDPTLRRIYRESRRRETA